MANYRITEAVFVKASGRTWPAGSIIDLGEKIPKYLEGKVELVKPRKSKSDNERKK